CSDFPSSRVVDGSSYNNSYFEGCTLNGSGLGSEKDGVAIKKVSNFAIVNFTISNFSRDGIKLSGASGNSSSNVYIVGNTVTNSGAHGIQCPQRHKLGVIHTGVRIWNNTVIGAALVGDGKKQHGIYSQCQDSEVIGNYVEDVRAGTGITMRSSGIVRGNRVRVITNPYPNGINYYSDHHTGPSDTLIIENNVIDYDSISGSGDRNSIRITEETDTDEYHDSGEDGYVHSFIIRNNAIVASSGNLNIRVASFWTSTSGFSVSQSGNVVFPTWSSVPSDWTDTGSGGGGGGGGGTPVDPPPPLGDNELPVLEDAFVRQGDSTNYGSDPQIRVKTSSSSQYTRNGFVKVDISSIDSDLNSAQLVLHVVELGGDVGSTPIGQELRYVPDNSWSESSINGNNEPTSTFSVAQWGVSSSSNTEVVLDITSAVQAGLDAELDSISLEIRNTEVVSGGRDIHYGSKEQASADNRPQVFVDVDDPAPPPTEMTLFPTDDAYIRQGNSTNYGSDDQLRIKKSSSSQYTRQAYLKFDIRSVSPALNSASLQLKVVERGSQVGSSPIRQELVYVPNTGWSESSINGNNEPSSTFSVADWSVTSGSNDVVTLDVTAAVQAGLNANQDFITLEIRGMDNVSGARDIYYGSKEQSLEADQPQLMIDADTPSLVELSPSDDSFVQQSNSNNYGNDSQLRVKRTSSNQYTRQAFLKFNVQSLSGTITNASLKLSLVEVGADVGSSAIAQELYLNPTTGWSESSIHGNNEPQLPQGAAPIAEWDARANDISGGPITLDVTAAVQQAIDAGEDYVTFEIRGRDIVSGGRDTFYGSKENSDSTKQPIMEVAN
ncbi:MAG: DNRLRE domain-containing protein, partial [Pseudomonadota bacterium]